MSGTPDLKPLAKKVLERNAQRNAERNSVFHPPAEQGAEQGAGGTRGGTGSRVVLAERGEAPKAAGAPADTTDKSTSVSFDSAYLGLSKNFHPQGKAVARDVGESEKPHAGPAKTDKRSEVAPQAAPKVTPLYVPPDCPDAWADGFARLLSMPAPRPFDAASWAVLIGDARDFYFRWSPTAARLGWSDLAVWGCHPRRPVEQLDCLGLVPSLQGRLVLDLTETAAVIQPAQEGGARLRFYRPGRMSEAVPLWRLGQ